MEQSPLTGAGRRRRVIATAAALLIGLIPVLAVRHAAADVGPVTGTFYADDNGVYYMQQSGTSLWWMGESVPKDPNPQGGYLGPMHVWNRGLDSTSVFRGTVNGTTASGTWVEVSRGSSMRTGSMTLSLDTVTDDFGPHVHLTLAGGTAPNGASDWLQHAGPTGDRVDDSWHQDSDGTIVNNRNFFDRFQNAKKSIGPGISADSTNGDPLGDTHNPEELRPYRDQTVFYGNLETQGPDNNEAPHINMPSPGTPGAFAYTYHNFVCYAVDGDLDLRVRVDSTSLTTDFLSTEGWSNVNSIDEGESSAPGSDYHDILPKLQPVGPFSGGGFHMGVEGVMYAGDKDAGCPTSANLLFPGWAASPGDSILINGRAVDGYNEPGNIMIAPNPIRPVDSGQTALAGLNGYPMVAADPANGINTGTEVRITGPVILDCGHSDLDDPDTAYFTPNNNVHTCDQGEAWEDSDDQNQELHPVYSIDLIECPLGYAPDYCPPDNNTARQNLTGAWGSQDGGTYYVRQIGNDIWWAGLTRNRDPMMPDDTTQVPSPIANPTDVFHGTVTNNPDGSATITGDAITVPKGLENGGDTTTATFTVNPNRKAMDLVSSTSATFPWGTQFHFDKLYEPPDTTPPSSSLGIGTPQYTAGGTTFVTSATPLTLTASDDQANNVQNLWYRTYPAGSTAPSFTPVAGNSTTLHLTGADGAYTIDTYATDNAGNDEAPHTTTVYLDNTAPAITVTSPAATSYTHSSTITLGYGANDGTGSGVAATTSTIDGSSTLANGTTLTNGLAVNLLTQLGLGSHTFAVTSSDHLGNTATQSVTFSIIVTPASIEADVSQFVASGDIKNKNLAKWLLSTLQAAAKAAAKGNCTTAMNDWNAVINKIRSSTSKSISPLAAGVLIGDAQYLIGHCP